MKRRLNKDAHPVRVFVLPLQSYLLPLQSYQLPCRRVFVRVLVQKEAAQNPLGFMLCQRHESSHISSSP